MTTDMYVTIPFCHLRLVHGQNNPSIHTWIAPAHENTACDLQSERQQMKNIKNVKSTKYFHYQT